MVFTFYLPNNAKRHIQNTNIACFMTQQEGFLPFDFKESFNYYSHKKVLKSFFKIRMEEFKKKLFKFKT